MAVCPEHNRNMKREPWELHFPVHAQDLRETKEMVLHQGQLEVTILKVTLNPKYLVWAPQSDLQRADRTECPIDSLQLQACTLSWMQGATTTALRCTSVATAQAWMATSLHAPPLCFYAGLPHPAQDCVQGGGDTGPLHAGRLCLLAGVFHQPEGIQLQEDHPAGGQEATRSHQMSLSLSLSLCPSSPFYSFHQVPGTLFQTTTEHAATPPSL